MRQGDEMGVSCTKWKSKPGDNSPTNKMTVEGEEVWRRGRLKVFEVVGGGQEAKRDQYVQEGGLLAGGGL